MAEWLRRQFDTGFPTYFPPLTQLCGRRKIPTPKDNKRSRVQLKHLCHSQQDATFMYSGRVGQEADRVFPNKVCIIDALLHQDALGDH